MKPVAWLFPGQGSQKVGMGLDFFNKTGIGKQYFSDAQEIMGFDIKSIIFNGPEDILRQTEYTQPAIYIISVIIGQLLIENGFKPSALAGHSLGEYSALTLAGAFDFNTGLKLVKLRSTSMAKSGLTNKGTMAAIVGLDDNKVESICHSYKGDGIVVPANYNSPGQIVISGSVNAVYWAMDIAKNSGAKITKELNVSGAFHSPLMKPAVENLAATLYSIEISDLSYPIFTNFDAKPKTKGSDIRDLLICQLENPVLWSQSILAIKNTGIESFLEVGPGKVLSGLNKRIDRSLYSNNIETVDQLENFFV